MDSAEFSQRIARNGLLFDGAMGSMLFKEQLPQDKPSEYWNLERPDIVRNIHRAYIRAGCQVITTNTFGASPPKLEKSGFTERIAEFNTAAAEIAREAAGTDVLVAGDIGPCGEMLAPYGTLTPDQAADGFRRQAEALEKGTVDFFLVETMFDQREALAAIQGIREVSSKPIFATLTFSHNAGRFATIMGNHIGDGLRALREAGDLIVGANCTIGSEEMVALAEQMRRELSGFLMVQPNAGHPVVKEGSVVYPESPEIFADNLKAITDIGIEIIGGCCGTTPDYIRRIATMR